MERRVQDSASTGDPIDVPCRHCWLHQPLDPARIDLKDGRAWHRCADCNEWYLVRWEDAKAAMKPV